MKSRDEEKVRSASAQRGESLFVDSEGFRVLANESVAVLPDENVAARVRRLKKPSRPDRGFLGMFPGPSTKYSTYEGC
jgi:hypothetical protein